MISNIRSAMVLAGRITEQPPTSETGSPAEPRCTLLAPEHGGLPRKRWESGRRVSPSSGMRPMSVAAARFPYFAPGTRTGRLTVGGGGLPERA